MHKIYVFHRQKKYFTDRIVEKNEAALHLNLP